MPLRPYQLLARLDVERKWRSGVRRNLLVMPTGGGKTHSAYDLVNRHMGRGGRVLWLAHLDILLEQSASTAEKYGHTCSVIKAQDKRLDYSNPLQVGSMQTFGRRLKKLQRELDPTLIVIDEAHRAVCNTYDLILKAWPGADVLGLSATPWRTDGKGLGASFDAIVSTTSPDKLIDGGFLVDMECREPSAPPSLKGVRKRGGEYVTSQLEERLKPGLGDVARGIRDAVEEGRGPVASFAASIAHSEAIRDALTAYGVRAEHVDASTDSDERGAILGEDGRIANGETQVVCSVGVLDEGVDCPTLGTVVLAAPTAASGRYLQRVGRGLRPSPGKDKCLVLDFGGNWRRHWWPTEDIRRFYSLDGSPERMRDEADEKPAEMWQCKKCFAIMPGARPQPGVGACPVCGHVEPARVVQVEDKGTQLGTVQRGEATTYADKMDAWDRLCARCVESSYKWQWAAMQYKSRFGFFPSRLMIGGLQVRLGRAA